MVVSPRGRRRRGHAAAELALLLPFLCLVCLIAVDYARIINAQVKITNCARNGALYLANQTSYSTVYSGTSGYVQAAKADADGLTPLTVTSYPDPASVTWPPGANWPSAAKDTYGNPYVTVTVTYTFTTLVNYPGIPSSTTLSRSVSMPILN